MRIQRFRPVTSAQVVQAMQEPELGDKRERITDPNVSFDWAQTDRFHRTGAREAADPVAAMARPFNGLTVARTGQLPDLGSSRGRVQELAKALQFMRLDSPA
jgi:hypothetical protein